MPAPDIGTGTIFTFAGLDAINITSISMSGISREAIDTTYLGSTTTKTSIPSDLYDAGTIECTFQVDTATPVTTQSIAIFYVSAGTVAAWSIAVASIGTWSGNGYVTDFSQDFTTEELITGSFTLTCTGAITTSNT